MNKGLIEDRLSSIISYPLIFVAGLIMLPYLLVKAWRRIIELLNRFVDNLLSDEESQYRSEWYRQEITKALEEKNYERVSFLEQEYKRLEA